MRAGKSVRAAISAGYGKGFHTILDANVVTAITAIVLFLIAMASVKGFALMLLIGTIISLLTAVAATRALLGLLSGFRWFSNPRFMGAHGQQTAKWLQIDFMKRRYVWFAMSGVIILAGAVSLGVRGLNLGIDFKGGTQVTFKTHKAYTPEEVRKVAAQVKRPDAVVQGRGAAVNGKYTTWQVRTRSLTGTAAKQLPERAEAAGRSVCERHQERLVEFRAPDRDRRDLGDHRLARPDHRLHRAAVQLQVRATGDRRDAARHRHHGRRYSLVFKEVSIATVAAVLTVLGYSIYDTIIIFDRVSENIPLMRRQPFSTIVNVSLWETIRRSLATTLHHAAADHRARDSSAARR